MFIPTTCPICGEIGSAPCGPCIDQLRLAPRQVAPADLTSLRSLVCYDATGSRLVASLKYRNARRTLRWLAMGLAAIAPSPIEVVTWAPTTPSRRRARGFDQAERLAAHLASELRLPLVKLLVRMDSQTQTGRNRSDRITGVRFRSFGLCRGRVAIIDDVTTTGATLVAAAKTLTAAGAAEVHGITVAQTAPGRS